MGKLSGKPVTPLYQKISKIQSKWIVIHAQNSSIKYTFTTIKIDHLETENR